jgi:Protein of unknown function (DUF3501)
VSVEPFGPGPVRTGAAYEGVREATRARLAAVADDRRVDLGGGLVLVFETVDTIRTALEETLRAERVDDAARVEAEAAAFGALVGGPQALTAVLYVDVADPVALGDRVAELHGIAEHVFLDVDGSRVPARADSADDSPGALPLVFALQAAHRAALLAGARLAVAVDHPACRVTVAMSTAQVQAATADLRR